MSTPLTRPSLQPSFPVTSGLSLRKIELRGWFLLLCLINLSLIGGHPAVSMNFNPNAILAGQWWRLLSWPLVHVSSYHLLLDGSAFLLLLHGLEENSFRWRCGYVLLSAIGSLALPILLAPNLAQTGLCGLSGPAHGLALVSALELIVAGQENQGRRNLGWLLLGGLLAKAGWELWQGQVFFSGLHLGNIGHPVVSTHAGGILGGALAYLLRQLFSRKRSCQRPEQPLN